MKNFTEFIQKNKDAMRSKTARVGGYSFAIAVILLAVLIVVNLVFSALPSTWTHYDMSSTRLYSITSSTKAVVQNLDKDVTIYWITQSGEEDTVIEKLLDVYAAQNSHLSVVKKNPDIYPTFAAQYTDETVRNNSIIVECGDRYRYIAYDDIYIADTSDYYTTGSVAYEFDGEGMITTAINYVISDDLPKIYTLTGHGETEITGDFLTAIERQNIETEEFSLLNVDSVPEDAETVIINAPTSDISDEEVKMLESYLSEGGKLIVCAGPQEEETLENLKSLLNGYGVSYVDGIVVEEDRNYYAFSYPYVLLPELGDSEIVSELAENNSYIIVPLSQGMNVDAQIGGVTVTELLTTSSSSFSKTAGYEMETFDKEDDDTDGPFALAVSIEDSSSGASIVWVSSDMLLSDTYNSYSSGANCDFFMNALSWTIGETESISIRSKSLDYNYLTISTSQASMIKLCMIGLIPAIYLIYGIDEVIRRKKRT